MRKMNKGATVPMSGGFKVAFVHAVKLVCLPHI